MILNGHTEFFILFLNVLIFALYDKHSPFHPNLCPLCGSLVKAGGNIDIYSCKFCER